MARILSVVCCLVLLGYLSPDAGARTWRLEADGSGECANLKAGVDSAAVFGDTLLLAPGVYEGAENREVDFLGKDICVTSSGGSAVTTIDCKNSGRAVVLLAGESGEIYMLVANGLVERNTIAENHCGGLYLSAAEPIVTLNIVAFNTAGQAITCQSSANPTVDCNLFYGNLAGDAVCGTDAGDNVMSDPLFCGSPLSGDFSIDATSPCAPATSTCGERIGAFGVGCSTSPAVSATWGRLKSLYLDDE